MTDQPDVLDGQEVLWPNAPTATPAPAGPTGASAEVVPDTLAPSRRGRRTKPPADLGPPLDPDALDATIRRWRAARDARLAASDAEDAARLELVDALRRAGITGLVL